MKRIRATMAGGGLGLVAAAVALLLIGPPRSDRDWARDHAVEARVTFEGQSVRVDSVRAFRHSRRGAYEALYRSETFGLADVWFVLAPFTGRWSGLAHTFVSFELAGGRLLAISVEAGAGEGLFAMGRAHASLRGHVRGGHRS